MTNSRFEDENNPLLVGKDRHIEKAKAEHLKESHQNHNTRHVGSKIPKDKHAFMEYQSASYLDPDTHTTAQMYSELAQEKSKTVQNVVLFMCALCVGVCFIYFFF